MRMPMGYMLEQGEILLPVLGVTEWEYALAKGWRERGERILVVVAEGQKVVRLLIVSEGGDGIGRELSADRATHRYWLSVVDTRKVLVIAQAVRGEFVGEPIHLPLTDLGCEDGG